MERREFLKFIPLVLGLAFAQKVGVFPSAFAGTSLKPFSGMDPVKTHGHNFRAIYGDDRLRAKFHGFLENVYSIYPNKEFHKLILEATQAYESDEDIYKEIQRRLPEVTPLMSLIRYSIPTLVEQKEEMAEQTAQLLSGTGQVENYVEIGSPGTYIKGVKKSVKVRGESYILHTDNPHYSPEDMIQRGSIFKAGEFVDMKDYSPISPQDIKPHSIELVTNYIGFHHASAERRRVFIESVVNLIPSGGQLVLRDHDVVDQTMAHIVALAHDVFNAGLMTEWKINEEEIRNFTTVAQVEEELAAYGMYMEKAPLLQKGDPTLNNSMVFRKS